ncbi:hypothetical protein BAME_13750 [Bacillus sp. M 2-6]|nr:hypothetical protein BAME_13750 [Bacillus sp. M 2-6]
MNLAETQSGLFISISKQYFVNFFLKNEGGQSKRNKYQVLSGYSLF